MLNIAVLCRIVSEIWYKIFGTTVKKYIILGVYVHKMSVGKPYDDLLTYY